MLLQHSSYPLRKCLGKILLHCFGKEVIMDLILWHGGSHPVFCAKMDFILCNCKSTFMSVE